MAEILQVAATSVILPITDLKMELDTQITEEDVKDAIAEWLKNFDDQNQNLIAPENG